MPDDFARDLAEIVYYFGWIEEELGRLVKSALPVTGKQLDKTGWAASGEQLACALTQVAERFPNTDGLTDIIADYSKLAGERNIVVHSAISPLVNGAEIYTRRFRAKVLPRQTQSEIHLTSWLRSVRDQAVDLYMRVHQLQSAP